MKYLKRARNAILALSVVGTMGFGVLQATASTEPTTRASCGAFACRTECAPFGGDLVPGGPGRPLQCACCG
jgi:hypothetical protein